MKKVIGFIRLSTEEQAAEGRAGLLRQRADIETAEKRHGLEIIRMVQLVGVSGAAVLEAPEFQQMLADLGRPGIDGVVVSALDRLARPDSLGALAAFDPFLKHGKLIWIPEQVIDMREDSGFLLTGVQALLAGMERKQILRRVQVAKEEKRKRGRHTQAKICLPFGTDFDFASGRWSWKEPEASQVRRAFEMLLEGRSVRSIARQLGGTPRGWGIRLRNPTYVGVREYTHKRGEKYPSRDGRHAGRRKVRREEPLRVKIDLEPLISQTQWDEAQLILSKSNRHWHSSRSDRSRFELTGIVFCGQCGERLYSKGDRRRGKHDFYFCKSRRPKGLGCRQPVTHREDLEDQAAKVVSDLLLDPARLEALLAAAPQSKSDAEIRARFEKAEQGLTRVETERRNVVRFAAKGLLRDEDLERETGRLDQEARFWKEERRRAQAETVMGSQSQRREMAEAVAAVFAEFEFLAPEERRKLYRLVTPRMKVEHKQIQQVTLRVPAPGAKPNTRGDRGSWRPPA